MIWIIQTAFIGDCVLTLPLIHEVLRTYPEERLKIFTHRLGRELFTVALERGLRAFANRIEIVDYDKRKQHRSFFSLLGLVERERRLAQPTLVFCPQRSFRTGLLAFLSRAPQRLGFSSGAAAFFYSRAVRREWESGRPEIEKNLDLLRALVPELPPWSPKNAPSLLQTATGERATAENPVMSLAMGSPWLTKRWPVANAIELVKRVIADGVPVKLLGDASAQPLAEELQRAVPSLMVKNLCGQTDIRQWIAEIQSSSLLVGNDSAAVHVASDLNVPVMALFGPTLPDFGFAPWRRDSLALGVNALYCRPCHIHGPKICPEGHHRCLKEIKGEEVYKHFSQMIVKISSGR